MSNRKPMTDVAKYAAAVAEQTERRAREVEEARKPGVEMERQAAREAGMTLHEHCRAMAGPTRAKVWRSSGLGMGREV
jgi:hypothetical protein